MSDPHLTSNRYFRAAVLEALESVMPGGDVVEAAIQAQVEKLGSGELTTKGDVLGHDGSIAARLAVGADVFVLTADDASPLGVKWAAIPAGITDHGALTGKDDDDHTQYALLAGRAGGQILIGGGDGDTLVFKPNGESDAPILTLNDGGVGGLGGVLITRPSIIAQADFLNMKFVAEGHSIQIGHDSGSRFQIKTNGLQLDLNGAVAVRILASGSICAAGSGGRWEVPDGTIASPGLRFFNDINTGIFRSGADTLGISAGTIECARFQTVTGVARIGLYGVTPVIRGAVLTAEDATVIDATYGSVEEAVLNNVRTRLGEMEARMQDLGAIN